MARYFEGLPSANTSSINWEELTGKLAGSIAKIGQDKKAAREENDRILNETQQILNKPIDLQNQNLSQFSIMTADTFKKQALEMKNKLRNGEITSAEFKMFNSNAMTNWQNFAEQIKANDDRIKLYQERNTPDENGNIAASDGENFLMEQYVNAANLNNKKMVVGKDGFMYLQEFDENNNPVGAPIDYRDLSRPENMTWNRINLNRSVANVTDGWQAFQEWTDRGRGGEMTITSIRKQPGYNDAKIQAVNTIISDPKSAASIIVDNALAGGIYYTTDAERNAKLQAAIAKRKSEIEASGGTFTDKDRESIELSAIKMVKNANGELIPELTESQMTFAKQTVDRAIDMQMEYKISGSPKQQWAGGSNVVGGNGGGQVEGEIYPEMLAAWELSKSDRKGSEAKLTSMAKGEYIFKWEQGGLAVYKDTDALLMKQPTITNIGNLESLAPYIYGASGAKGTDEAIKLYKQERENYRARNPRSGGTNANPNDGASNSGGNARD
jgi:hypothetical protein